LIGVILFETDKARKIKYIVIGIAYELIDKCGALKAN
jgi:hypothetical protein